MVNYCVLCSTTSASSFHRFPKNEDKRSKWLQAINKNDVPRCAQLCSNHFDPSDYQETIYGLRSSLKKTAIPKIILQETNCDANNEATSSKEESHTLIQQNTSDKITIEEYSTECNDLAKDNHHSLKRKSMEDEIEIFDPLKYIKHLKDINVHEVSKNQDEAAMVLEFAIETITEQKKKIRHLQKHVYKLKKRVQSLTELTKHLLDNNSISNKALKQ